MTKLCSGVDAHDAEVRVQRRERIVGDLRPRVRDRRDQRRLAGVRHAEQADVGQHLAARACSWRCSPGSAGRLLARRAVRARLLKCMLPKPPSPPLASSTCSPWLEQLGDQLAGVGIADDRCRPACAATMSSAAAPYWSEPRPFSPLRRLVAARVAVVDQRVEVAVGDARRRCRRGRRRRRSGRRTE